MNIEIPEALTEKTLIERNLILEEENRFLKKEGQFLRKRLEELDTLIMKWTKKKTSKNISRTKSQHIDDEIDSTSSMRQSNDPSSESQDGFEEDVIPNAMGENKQALCEKCGKDLSDELSTQIGAYQIFNILDIPKVSPNGAERHGLGTICICGHRNSKILPRRAVVYGREVKGYINYSNLSQ